jgi:hypothetical protein
MAGVRLSVAAMAASGISAPPMPMLHMNASVNSPRSASI